MKSLRLALILAIALVPLCAIAALAVGAVTTQTVGHLITLSAFGLGMAYAAKDNSTEVYDAAAALPNGAASTNSDTFDLGVGAKGDVPGTFEVEIVAPALATGVLGDGATMTYDIYHDTASDMSSEAKLLTAGIQTGAGGAGAATATYRFRLPIDTNRYIRVKATNSAAGDASGSDMSVRLVF